MHIPCLLELKMLQTNPPQRTTGMAPRHLRTDDWIQFLLETTTTGRSSNKRCLMTESDALTSGGPSKKARTR